MLGKNSQSPPPNREFSLHHVMSHRLTLCHSIQIRQSVLIPAFLRSMRDPFSPARIAGILALSATQTYYSLRDTATKVMPALCHLTMDPEKSVRDQAFKALKGFISKIEKVSEDPSLSTQMG